jgi:hypothetical protein
LDEAGTLIVNTRRTCNVAKMAAIAASAAIAIFATTTGGLAQGNQGQNGNGQGQNGNGQGHNHSVPAPAIDTGVPAMIVVGGVLLGTTLIRRLRKS